MTPAPEFEAASAFSPALRQLCRELHASSGAENFGVSVNAFEILLAAIVAKYQPDAPDTEVAKFLRGLRVGELALARGCVDGNERAWQEFLTRFRAPLFGAAYSITKDDATARELADSLYAELYGLGSTDGQRRPKLAYYTGRGSLEGWLRTVVAQEFVNRYRTGKHTVSLEEKVEDGEQFAAPATVVATASDDRIEQATSAALAELEAEDRFILAAYFLDGRTLAEVGRILRIHESTVSRKLDRLVDNLRKKIRYKLKAAGMGSREIDEAMQDIDVRDLQVDLRAKLQQESPGPAFYKKGED